MTTRKLAPRGPGNVHTGPTCRGRREKGVSRPRE